MVGKSFCQHAPRRPALTFIPAHIGTWHGQGWAQVLRRDLAAARRSFQAALELDRNFAESHGALAVVLALEQQEQAARKHIELAKRLDVEGLSARYAEAVLTGEAQDTQAVQRLAQRLLGGRKAPLGGAMRDWLTSNARDPKQN
jgi:Flp pilus assembly protein TadD